MPLPGRMCVSSFESWIKSGSRARSPPVLCRSIICFLASFWIVWWKFPQPDSKVSRSTYFTVEGRGKKKGAFNKLGSGVKKWSQKKWSQSLIESPDQRLIIKADHQGWSKADQRLHPTVGADHVSRLQVCFRSGVFYNLVQLRGACDRCWARLGFLGDIHIDRVPGCT